MMNDNLNKLELKIGDQIWMTIQKQLTQILNLLKIS